MDIDNFLLVTSQAKGFWTATEWVCAIIAVMGTVWAAAKKGESLYVSLILWLLSSVGFIAMHTLYTKQYGLLTLSIVGFILTAIGLWNHLEKNKQETNSNYKKQTVLWLCYLFTIIGIVCFGLLLFDPGADWFKSKYFEWSATFLNLAGLTAISSNSRMSKYCWIFWGLSNAMLAVITYSAGQMALFSQQIFFSCLNIWGIIGWLLLSHKAKKEVKSKELIEEIK